MRSITKVNVYRSSGEWCYSAWIGDEFDCSDVLDADSAEEAIEEARQQFSGAEIVYERTVCGHQIQHDASGQGHAFRNIDRYDIPASIVEEIEGEIIDGKQETCEKFVGSNGLHYRW